MGLYSEWKKITIEKSYSRQLRPKTMLSYEQTLKLFGVWLADTTAVTRVEDIREKHIRAYIVELQERGKYTLCSDRKAQKHNCPQNRRDYCAKISNTTINNYIRNLKAYFAWLVEMEMLTVSPLRRVKPLPEERKPKEYMDDDEVKRLLKCMDKSYYAEYRDMMAIMLMLDAGTRLSETLTIEVEAVDLSEQTVVLPADKTKGRKERTVFFSDRTAKELRRWLQFKDRYCESPYLLPVKSTGRVVCLCDFEKNFRKYVLRAGIKKKVSPHTLRNNFARRCLMAGMDIYTIRSKGRSTSRCRFSSPNPSCLIRSNTTRSRDMDSRLISNHNKVYKLHILRSKISPIHHSRTAMQIG